MQKAYTPIDWKNYPDTSTPLNETNLNKIDTALDTVDTRVVGFDTTKANQTDLLQCISGATYNTTTGVIVLTWQNGSSLTIDLNIEKIPVSFTMSDKGVITMTTTDGTTYTADVGSIIKPYNFVDSATIDFTVTASVDPTPLETYFSDEVTTTTLTLSNLSGAPDVIKIEPATTGQNLTITSFTINYDTAASTGLTESYAIGANSTTTFLPTTLKNLNSIEVVFTSTGYDYIITGNAISEKNVTADIKNGSVTEQKLYPNFLADIRAVESQADADALRAEGHAVGQQNGVDVGPSSPYYQNNAKYYAEQAQGGSGGHVIKDATSTFTQRNGLKFLGGVTITDDSNGDNTVVNVGAGAKPHLIVISESGSDVTATRVLPTETIVITATETSTGHFECDLSTPNPQDVYGTWTIDAVLGGDDAQVSLVVDTIKIYTIDDSHFHADITVTYPTGATVSCSKTGEQTMYATGSPYTFVVHSAGTWTITGTRNSVTETQSVVITTTGQEESITLTILPDGSTVTPTDDVQTLLQCADIWDKTTYTTISDLLADDTSLLTVLTSDNAIDYLVRSTTFASAITADSDAMAMIGSYDYAVDTLLADSTWASAIGGSTYATSVWNVSVPTMTSDTTPKGVASASTIYNADYKAYKAFDGNSTSAWADSGGSSPHRLSYQFEHAVKIFAYTYNTYANNRTNTYKIQSSDDSTNWTDNTSIRTAIRDGQNHTEILDTFTTKKVYSFYTLSQTDTITTLSTLQFYGRENGGVQSWLRAGGITDKAYTTISELASDSTTLLALISNHDASDYLVTAKGLISDICANQTIMSYIGLDNYCSNKLLTDADWKLALLNSQYRGSVYNLQVPTMTSNTTPEGECFANMDYSGHPWNAFDKDAATTWTSYGNSFAWPDWVGYEFPTAVKCYGFTLQIPSHVNQYKIQASVSGTGDTWVDLYSGTAQLSNVMMSGMFDDSVVDDYKRYRVYCVNAIGSGGYYAQVSELQFYGRVDV